MEEERRGAIALFYALPRRLSLRYTSVGLCQSARTSLHSSAGGWVSGRVMHHPYSPGVLAKAAAPGRASSERGGFFCRLQVPSLSSPCMSGRYPGTFLHDCLKYLRFPSQAASYFHGKMHVTKRRCHTRSESCDRVHWLRIPLAPAI